LRHIELFTEESNFILKELTERLNKLELKTLRKPTNVVVGLYRR
jgi:hypothetical protein